MTTTAPHYGNLCDYKTGEVIRRATAIEAEESSTQSGDDGVIYVDGRDCYVEGPVVVMGRIIERDTSGVGHNWRTIGGVISPSIAEELAGEIAESQDGGMARIGGVWYRWSN